MALTVLAASVTLASGCSSAPPAMAKHETKRAELTSEEAKAEIREMYELTKNSVGGTWTTYSRNWWTCSSSEAEPRAAYSMMYRRAGQPLPSDPADVAEQLREIWSAHGHRVEVVFDKSTRRDHYILSDPPWLSGSSPDLPLIQFTVGEDYASFKATSRCVPGDYGELGTQEPERGQDEGEIGE
ncbi:hypothetical protein ACFVWR_18565 [Leifsonia sp. NPDC058292]|uniref:hypothetical protein n=1 Tax=Leifsonia sp. NPDC058292 TaxID=3346428 RepID=UPI0036DE958F